MSVCVKRATLLSKPQKVVLVVAGVLEKTEHSCELKSVCEVKLCNVNSNARNNSSSKGGSSKTLEADMTRAHVPSSSAWPWRCPSPAPPGSLRVGGRDTTGWPVPASSSSPVDSAIWMPLPSPADSDFRLLRFFRFGPIVERAASRSSRKGAEGVRPAMPEKKALRGDREPEFGASGSGLSSSASLSMAEVLCAGRVVDACLLLAEGNEGTC